jgi:hypothetical protein
MGNLGSNCAAGEGGHIMQRMFHMTDRPYKTRFPVGVQRAEPEPKR